MKDMRWLRLAAAVLALLLSVLLPQLAAAGGAATTGATTEPTVTVTVASEGDASTEPGTLFAVRYYLRRVVESLRLLLTLDTPGDAALLAEFAEARADTLARLDPESEWYDRLAADIATFLRLAQDRLVQARVDGEPADEALAALREVVERLKALVAEFDQAMAGDQDETAGGAPGTEGEKGVAPGDEAVAGDETGQGSEDALEDAREAAEETEVVVDVVTQLDPAVVQELRAQGYGYGQIALLYAAAQRISEKSGEQVTVQEVADLVAQGGSEGGRYGFGKSLRAVLAQYGIERHELKPGGLVKMIRGGAGEDGEEGDEDESTGAGEDKDQAGDEDGGSPIGDREDETGGKNAARAWDRGKVKVGVGSRADAKAKGKVKAWNGRRGGAQGWPAVGVGRNRDDDDESGRRMGPWGRTRNHDAPGYHQHDDGDDDD